MQIQQLAEPLLLPTRSSEADSVETADYPLDSAAFCIAPCVDCLDVACAIAIFVLSRMGSLDQLLGIAAACALLLTSLLGFCGRRAYRMRWLLPLSAVLSLGFAVLALGGGVVVIAGADEASSWIASALENERLLKTGSGSDNASEVVDKHFAAVGIVLCCAGMLWLARAVALTVIAIHLKRNHEELLLAAMEAVVSPSAAGAYDYTIRKPVTTWFLREVSERLRVGAVEERGDVGGGSPRTMARSRELGSVGSLVLL